MPDNACAQIASVEERSAEKYVDAVNAVIGLANMAVPLLVPGGKAAAVAGAVAKAAPIAQVAAAQPPKVAPVVAPIAKKAADAGARRVGVAAKGAASRVGGALGGPRDAVKSAADAQAQERARKLARKTPLDGAGIRMSAEKFMENWAMQASLGGAAGAASAGVTGGYLAYSGCYVIITCDGAVRKDDYSRYRELYVGKAENMGASIRADFVGLGNPDVYADVKYKQHVYVLLYPCEQENLDALEASLVTALDADASYNHARAWRLPVLAAAPGR